MPASTRTIVTVDGHRIALTNLDKVMYPETGTTKADVLDYYARVADALIPHIRDRPVTRKRWVHGVGTADEPGEVFFQKNLEANAPDWVAHRGIEHSDHANEYPIVNDLATLTWLAHIAALELHVPQWKFDRHGERRNPDRLVLDLDPGDGAGLQECAEVARLARDLLTGMGLDPMPVTSGSTGIHLYAALDGSQTSDRMSAVAHELARALEADHPDLIVSDMKKSLRTGKVLVDWSQNNGSKTTIAPYSLRGRLRPMVAAPRTWRELGSSQLAQLDYLQVLERLSRRADPLAEVGADQGGPPDRLAMYRSMRDASKTPEPVPTAASVPTEGKSFVIQEHHARRLHFDFRLERDGVLVSWALPKGVPTDASHNHLAVQTEDHPLEYGAFEGSIPTGEYGAGEVTIWDSGTYKLEKWRDGKEVIVTLYGEKCGTQKYALIHTGGEGRADNNWLIHLMTDDASDADPGTKTPPPKLRARTVIGAPRRASAVQPMLATLGTVDTVSPDDDWVFEMKWDGIRAIATVTDGGVVLASRNGIDLTASYPELSELADAIDGNAVLDGEIVALGRTGRPDFSKLQTRMNLTKAAEVAAARTLAPVQLLLFDLIEADGTSLVREPWTRRRQLLENLVNETASVKLPPVFGTDLDAAMSASRELKLEGVMAKRADSTYLAGRRGSAWIKLKHHLTHEVVIGGWRAGRGGRAGGIGSLLVGIPDGDASGLRYVGRVGTGFSDAELDRLHARLARSIQKASPFADVPAADASDATWVTPVLVGEVEFAEWTGDHAGEGRLRQPSWRGLRPDKAPADVGME